MAFRKTYFFAFTLASLLSFVASALLYFFSFYFKTPIGIRFILLFFIVLLGLSFVIIQSSVKNFIYKQVQKIYSTVAFLDVADVDKKAITSDMDTLSKKVKEFAEGKRLEIEMLQLREGYRREFLGNISHELKTPIFTIQGYILTLLEGAVKSKEMRTQYLTRANIGVERLIAIVKDLDMIAKLESGDLNLKSETIDIVKLIKTSFDLLEIKAQKKGVNLTFNKNYDVPILVKGDEERLEQVLINLIMNSIKYGKIKGTTVVSISIFSDTQFIVTIKDNGEGIKAVHLPRLFERFYRVDKSRSREQGGSGLGLSIVKHIVESHKQQVSVKSTLGKGTSFSFTLERAL